MNVKYVNQISVKEKESFYTQFGFEVRPNEKVGVGMTQLIYYKS